MSRLLTAGEVLKDAPMMDEPEPDSLPGIVARIERLQTQLDEMDDEHERRRAPLVHQIDNLTSRRAEQTSGTSGGNDAEQFDDGGY